ncbi:MAG: hypothetical protein A3G70_04195 [Planctomycetes bacterium RIFCSPLOWO2_12_FULL_39_13]|nr:MAG: hypothetical protein A3G70_04195 [Planctomycetes bacterium RIFCSPLOWO2_12_FULL_39_13]
MWNIKLFPLTRNLFRDIFVGTSGALIPFAFFVFIISKKAENIPLIGSLRKTLIIDVRGLFSQAKLLDLCLISIFAGVAEELLFRGVIQVKFGIIAASVIFGLFHFITPAYCILAGIMGFYVGTLFHEYQSILIPIQLHLIYDLGALVYLRYFIKS